MSALRFRFRLRPIEEITPWGDPGRENLSWFGLTDGWQNIETSAGRLLEYARPWNRTGCRWLDYPVVRLFEDLLEMWPWVADPVPHDVASRFYDRYGPAQSSDIAERLDPEGEESSWQILSSLGHRELIFSHLTLSPRLLLWQTSDELNLRWSAPGRDDAGPRWAVQDARVVLPFEEARLAVETFCGGLLSAMAERTRLIARDGWVRRDCTVDVAQLIEEQRQRETWPAAHLSRRSETDWDAVRHFLGKLA